MRKGVLSRKSEREKRVQRDIVRAIGALDGIIVYENWTDRTQKTNGEKTWYEHGGLGVGTPDLVVIYWGRIFGLEVKAEDGKPEETQLTVQAQWRAVGAVYEFVRSVEEAMKALGKT